MEERNLSHGGVRNSLDQMKEKIEKRKDLPYASVEQQLGILDLISQCDLGEFLIARGGLNGYWTHYVVSYPTLEKKSDNPVESFVLEKAPTSLATQQRFVIFKEEIAKRLKEGICMASVPCGVMGEFLDLDYSIKEFELHGLDIDEQTLSDAKEYASSKGLLDHCHFEKADAWDLGRTGQFDLIASNGLSVYVEDDEKVVALYEQFFKALKPEGTLITSFLSPPQDWDVAHVVQTDALMQKLIFADILDCGWESFRTAERSVEQLKRAGFSSVEVRGDKASIFPTLIAQKL